MGKEKSNGNGNGNGAGEDRAAARKQSCQVGISWEKQCCEVSAGNWPYGLE